MDIVTDDCNIAPFSGGLRCSAKSKRAQRQCKNAALTGATKCRMHGGSLELKPSARLTHGITSKFVKTEDLPALFEKVRELDTDDGRKEALKRSYAVLDLRLDHIPEGVDHAEIAVRVHDSKRKDIALLHDIEKSAEQAAPQLPVFNIAIGDATQQAPFEARTLDGHCTVRMLDGKPFLFDAATGGWMPAQLRKDEDSGAEFYERVLALNAPEG
jgi:hypothetical protein